MSIAPPKPIAWSHSALNQFLSCPKQYYHVRVAKDFKDEPSEQLLWGDRVHKFMEQELNHHVGLLRNNVRQHRQSGSRKFDIRGQFGNNDNLVADARPLSIPPTVRDAASEFQAFTAIAERFAKTKGELATEQQLAITASFKPTGWFGSDVWCRGVLDARWLDGSTARVIDWKTGKRKKDSRQLILFSLLIFAHYPEVQRVVTSFVWLQTGKMDVEKFQRKDVPKLWQEFLPDVRRLEYASKTQTWIPKPSGLCNGWCPVHSCSFWNGDRREDKVGTATA